MERADKSSREPPTSAGGSARSARGDDIEAARELVGQARVAEQGGHAAKALGLYDDALGSFKKGSADPYLADILRWKGTLLRERGETEAASRCYTKSLDQARLSGSTGGEAHALNCLAIICQRRGDNKEAERLYAQAASLAEKVGDARLLGMIQQNRGVLANMHGEFALASSLYSESLAAFEAAGDSGRRGNASPGRSTSRSNVVTRSFRAWFR